MASILENAATPPEIYLWRDREPEWRKRTSHGDAIKLDDLGVRRVEKIRWRSTDDRFDLEGFVVKPKDFHSGKRYPLLVFIHGGPGAAVRDEFNLLVGVGGLVAQVFAAEGYLVFLPNFRGDRDYGTEFHEARHGELGPDYDYDIDAGVDELIVRGWADGQKLGIVGHSFGATQAIYAISHSRRYKAAVLNDNGHIQLDVSLPQYQYTHDVTQYNRGGNPLDFYASRIGYDPIQTIWADPYRIRTPLILRWKRDYHSAAFERTLGISKVNFAVGAVYASEVAQSAKLYTALSRNGVPMEIIVDGDGHQILTARYLLEFQSRLLQWFDYYILGKGDCPLPAMTSPIDYAEGTAAPMKGVRVGPR